MEYCNIKERIKRLINEELEIELNRKTYLIGRYMVEQLGERGREWVNVLSKEDTYFIEELGKVQVEELGLEARRVYMNVMSYLLDNNGKLEASMTKGALNRAIEISQELFREELEEKYSET